MNEQEESLSLARQVPKEILEKLPIEVQEQVKASFSMLSVESRSSSVSPILRNITSEHVDKIIDNQDSREKRALTKFLVGEGVKVVTIGAVIAVLLIILNFAKTTNDRAFAEKIYLTTLSGVLSFVAGYGFGRKA